MHYFNLNSFNLGANPLMHLSRELFYVVLVASIVLGVLQCFMGYRIFKVLLGVFGFGFASSMAYTIAITSVREVAPSVGIAVVVGCVGAVLAVALYFIGIFLMGAFFAGGALYLISLSAGAQIENAVIIVIAVIGGIVAIALKKLVIILSTAFGGAWQIIWGVGYFVPQVRVSNLEYMIQRMDEDLIVIGICWLILGIAGIVVQYKPPSTENNDTEEEADESVIGVIREL